MKLNKELNSKNNWEYKNIMITGDTYIKLI